jgi:hypothetical protein
MAEQGDNYEVAAAPSRLIQNFLGFMLALLCATLLIGQFNLPYYGASLWDLGAAGMGWLYEWACAGVRLIITAMSERFPIVIGALGVSWLTIIHLRVQRTGRYSAGLIDILFVGYALGGIAAYFYFIDQVLPLDATFFYRMALYCAIAVLSFGVGGAASALSEKLEHSIGGEEWPFIVLLIGGIAVGLATGIQGEGFRFSGINIVLHLCANLGAAAIGIGYEGRVSYIVGKRDKAQAAAEKVAAA